MARMFQIQIPIGNLPINLILVGNQLQAGVAFVRVREHGTILDTNDRGDIEAVFERDSFTIFEANDDAEFEYETIYDYKSIPLMLRWLQRQNLQEPTDVVFHM